LQGALCASRFKNINIRTFSTSLRLYCDDLDDFMDPFSELQPSLWPNDGDFMDITNSFSPHKGAFGF
jgi:hypothetical protein